MINFFLRATRWILIGVLSIFLGYVLFETAKGLVRSFASNQLDWVQVLFPVFLAIFICVIPAVMLHSLVTKRLLGLASSLGATIALTGFVMTVGLPQRFDLFDRFDSITFLPMPIKVFLGLALGLSFIILPYWLLSRVAKLTHTVIYPKYFKPLEKRL